MGIKIYLSLSAGLVTWLVVGYSCLAIQPQKGKPMEAISSRQGLEQNIGKRVSLYGAALEAKAGAVVKTAGGLVYIWDLSAWPSELKGKEVIAEGVLVRKKIMPDPVTSSSGLTTQGAFGENFVLENASWKPAK